MAQVILNFQDGDSFRAVAVTKEEARLSALIQNILADVEGDGVQELPLLGIHPSVVDLIIGFMRYHVNDPMREIKKPIKTAVLTDHVSKWDAEFVGSLDHDTQFRLVTAANYLDISSLIDLCLTQLACLIKDKEPEEIRKTFGIDTPTTPEEEQKIREDNPWIFEISPQQSQ